MKFSIIIPAFNAEKTIRQCLESIFSSIFKDFEVILISNCCTDATVDIAKKFQCRIIHLEKNFGPAYARTIGEKEANQDILVFVDSDVAIKKETLSKFKNSFEKEPDLKAIVGLFSKSHPNKDFFSEYKNFYMHFIFSKCPRYIDFIFGSIFAAKKGVLEPPHITTWYGEDTELGMKLNSKGHKILLNKDIEVVHFKKYSFFSFMRNDFRIPFFWAKLFLNQRGWTRVVEKKRFSHARVEQIISIVVSFMILISLFIQPFLSVFWGFIFIALNVSFFKFLFNERGMVFLLKAVFTTYLDMLVMGTAIAVGFLSYPLIKTIRPLRNLNK